jgi:general secretion pathway protein L
VIALGERVEAARTEANQAVELRNQLEQAAEASNFMRQKKADALFVSVLLRKLTELIPDHSWVNQLNVLGAGIIDIRGESEHATELIEILSRDPSFRDISFKSPVVGIRNTDRERFHIGFRFVSGGGAE